MTGSLQRLNTLFVMEMVLLDSYRIFFIFIRYTIFLYLYIMYRILAVNYNYNKLRGSIKSKKIDI